jgi:hypothetical protein
VFLKLRYDTGNCNIKLVEQLTVFKLKNRINEQNIDLLLLDVEYVIKAHNNTAYIFHLELLQESSDENAYLSQGTNACQNQGKSFIKILCNLKILLCRSWSTIELL